MWLRGTQGQKAWVLAWTLPPAGGLRRVLSVSRVPVVSSPSNLPSTNFLPISQPVI